MAERNSDDAAKNELKLKNPLLCSTVTGLSMDEFIHRAVLMPINTASASGDPKQNVAPHANASKNESIPENLKTDKTLLETQNPKPPDDDFDLAAYYARVHGTDPNPVKDDNAEAFSDIDLDSKSPDDDDRESVTLQAVQSGSVALDLAQNLSQLPQVLPQVASAVLGSFSNVLNMTRSSPWSVGNQNVSDKGIDVSNPNAPNLYRGEEISAAEAVENVGNFSPIPLFRTNDFGQVRDSDACGGTDAMGSVHGKDKQVSSSNVFRLRNNRKKTYAQVPGLTLGETHQPPVNFPQFPHVPPPTSIERPANQMAFSPINTDGLQSDLPETQIIFNPAQSDPKFTAELPSVNIDGDRFTSPRPQNTFDPFKDDCSVSTVPNAGKQSLNSEDLKASLAEQLRYDSDPNNPYSRLRESPVGFSPLCKNIAESNIVSNEIANNFVDNELSTDRGGSRIDSESKTADESFHSLQNSTLFTSVTCPNYAYIPVGTSPSQTQDNFGNIPYNEVTNANVSFTNTTRLENAQRPLFFDPTSFVSSQNVFHEQDVTKTNLSSNISQVSSPSNAHSPSISSPANFSTVPLKSSEPSAFPPNVASIPPPVSVSGNQFRLGSKKRPQYYSGPVEGAIALSQNVNKPTPIPGTFKTGSAPEIFNPIGGTRDETASVFSADLAFGASYPGNLGQVQTGYFKSGERDFGGNAAQSGIVNQGFSSQDSGFSTQQNTGINFSLEKLQSAVNLSKLQNVVTSFFDPNYFSDKKKTDSETTPDNDTFSIETVQPEYVSKTNEQSADNALNQTPTYYYRSTNNQSSYGTSKQTIQTNQDCGHEKQINSPNVPIYGRDDQKSAIATNFGGAIQTSQSTNERTSSNDEKREDSHQISAEVDTDHASVGAPLFFNPASCKPVDLTANVSHNKPRVFHDGSERLRKAPANYFAKQKNITYTQTDNPGSVMPDANAVPGSSYEQISSVIDDLQAQIMSTQAISSPITDTVDRSFVNPNTIISDANVVSDLACGKTLSSSIRNREQLHTLPAQVDNTAPLVSHHFDQTPIGDTIVRGTPVDSFAGTDNKGFDDRNAFSSVGAASFFDRGTDPVSSLKENASNFFCTEKQNQYSHVGDQTIAFVESIVPTAPPLCEVNADVGNVTSIRLSPSQLKNACNPEDIQEYVIEPSPDEEENEFEASTSKETFTGNFGFSHRKGYNESVFGVSGRSVSNEGSQNIQEMYSNEGCSSSGTGHGSFDSYDNAQSTSKSFFDDFHSNIPTVSEDVTYVNQGFNDEVAEDFDDNVSMICNVSVGLSSIPEDDLNSIRDDQNSLGTDDEMEKDGFEMMEDPKESSEALHDAGFIVETPSVTSETPSLVEEMRSYNLSNEQSKQPENESKASIFQSVLDSFHNVQLTSEPIMRQSIESDFSPDSMDLFEENLLSKQQNVIDCGVNANPVPKITDQHLSAFALVRDFGNENLVQTDFVPTGNADSKFVSNSRGLRFDSNNPIRDAAYSGSPCVLEDSSKVCEVIDSNVHDSNQYQQQSAIIESLKRESNLESKAMANLESGNFNRENDYSLNLDVSDIGSGNNDSNLDSGAIVTNPHLEETVCPAFKGIVGESVNTDLNLESNLEDGKNFDSNQFTEENDLEVNSFNRNSFGIPNESDVRLDSFNIGSSYSNAGFCDGDEPSNPGPPPRDFEYDNHSNLAENLQKVSPSGTEDPSADQVVEAEDTSIKNSNVTDETPIPFFNPFAFGLVKAQPDFAALQTAADSNGNTAMPQESCEDFENLQWSLKNPQNPPFGTSPDGYRNTTVSFFQNVSNNNEFSATQTRLPSIPVTNLFRTSTATQLPSTVVPGSGDFQALSDNTSKPPTTIVDSTIQFSTKLFQSSSGARPAPVSDFGTTTIPKSSAHDANVPPVNSLKAPFNAAPYLLGSQHCGSQQVGGHLIPNSVINTLETDSLLGVTKFRSTAGTKVTTNFHDGYCIPSIPTSFQANFPQRSGNYPPSFVPARSIVDPIASLPPMYKMPDGVPPIVQYPIGGQITTADMPPKIPASYTPAARSVSPLTGRYPKVPSSYQNVSNFNQFTQQIPNIPPSNMFNPVPNMQAPNVNHSLPNASQYHGNVGQIPQNLGPIQGNLRSVSQTPPNASQYQPNPPPTSALSPQYQGNLRQNNYQTPPNTVRYQSNLPPNCHNFPPASQTPQNTAANSGILASSNRFEQPANQFPPHSFSMPSENNDIKSPSHFFS